MKVKEWYAFNFRNERVNCNVGDVYVKVFRKKSYNNDDKIFEQLMDPVDMVNLFGEYQLFATGLYRDGYSALSILIYKEDYVFEAHY